MEQNNKIKPVRIQRSRQKKQESPNGLPIKYCGRGTKWGNPFVVTELARDLYAIVLHDSADERLNEIIKRKAFSLYGCRKTATHDAIECYKEYLISDNGKEGTIMEFYKAVFVLEHDLEELRGKNLSCWCNLDEECHVDYLLKLLNGE